jgi:hypothetical protein
MKTLLAWGLAGLTILQGCGNDSSDADGAADGGSGGGSAGSSSPSAEGGGSSGSELPLRWRQTARRFSRATGRLPI